MGPNDYIMVYGAGVMMLHNHEAEQRNSKLENRGQGPDTNTMILPLTLIEIHLEISFTNAVGGCQCNHTDDHI